MFKSVSTLTETIPPLNAKDLIDTLQTLLKHGFEPNERIDIHALSPPYSPFTPYHGHTPLQLLALIAHHLRQKLKHFQQINETSHKRDYNNVHCVVTIHEYLDIIYQIAMVLAQHGARMDIPWPTAVSAEEVTQEVRNDDECNKNINNGNIKIQKLSELLGSHTTIKDAEKKYQNMRSVEKHMLQHVITVPLSQKCENGDSKTESHYSDVKELRRRGNSSCYICWTDVDPQDKQHFCHASGFIVCGNCSQHKVVNNGVKHCVSDGQFNLASLTTFGDRAIDLLSRPVVKI